MTAVLIIVPGLCYAVASCMYAWQKNWPLAIVYSGYFWAQCGLVYLDRVMAK